MRYTKDRRSIFRLHLNKKERDVMNPSILAEANQMADTLTAWRRQLHQMPEVGLHLPQTAAFVQDTLRALDIPFHTIVNGNGVIAQLGQGERCLLLRADMDGLPITEEAPLTYVSTNGCMHACGHDCHATALLGAAKILKAHESELKGTIKLLFQPGEETFNGAKACMDDGVMSHPTVHAAVATHVTSQAPLGVVAYGRAATASVYGFKITVTGKGTHGAMPQDGVDPINVAVHIYQALQALIARECAPHDEVSLTIGQFTARSVNNIIPETAVLQGSLRTFDEDVRSFIIGRIHEVVPALATAFRAHATIEVLSDVPMVACDNALLEDLVADFQAMAPQWHIENSLHITASEDFALFSQQVPSAYFLVGAQDEGPMFAHHNPKTQFNEQALPIAAALYACAGLGWE